jgi:hypothetical protein
MTSGSRGRGSTPSASSKISGFSTLTPFKDTSNAKARFKGQETEGT